MTVCSWRVRLLGARPAGPLLKHMYQLLLWNEYTPPARRRSVRLFLRPPDDYKSAKTSAFAGKYRAITRRTARTNCLSRNFISALINVSDVIACFTRYYAPFVLPNFLSKLVTKMSTDSFNLTAEWAVCRVAKWMLFNYSLHVKRFLLLINANHFKLILSSFDVFTRLS